MTTRAQRKLQWATDFPAKTQVPAGFDGVCDITNLKAADTLKPALLPESHSSFSLSDDKYRVAISPRGAFVGKCQILGEKNVEVVIYAWHCGNLFPVWSFATPFPAEIRLERLTLADDGLSIAWSVECPPTGTVTARQLSPHAGLYLQTVDRAWLREVKLSAGSLFPLQLQTILAKVPFRDDWEFSTSYSSHLSMIFNANSELLFLVPTSNSGCKNLPLFAYDTHPMTDSAPVLVPVCTDAKFYPLRLVAFLRKHPDSTYYIHGAFLHPDPLQPNLLSVEVIHHQSGVVSKLWEVIPGPDGQVGTFALVPTPAIMPVYDLRWLPPHHKMPGKRLAIACPPFDADLLSFQLTFPPPGSAVVWDEGKPVPNELRQVDASSHFRYVDSEQESLRDFFPLTPRCVGVMYDSTFMLSVLNAQAEIVALRSFDCLQAACVGAVASPYHAFNYQEAQERPQIRAPRRRNSSSTTTSCSSSSSSSKSSPSSSSCAASSAAVPALNHFSSCVRPLGSFLTAPDMALCLAVCSYWRREITSLDALWFQHSCSCWGSGLPLILRAIQIEIPYQETEETKTVHMPNPKASTMVKSKLTPKRKSAVVEKQVLANGVSFLAGQSSLSWAQFYFERVRFMSKFASIYVQHQKDKLSVHVIPL